MTGLTLNCELGGAEHVMSMMYAVDRVGLDIIMKSGAIYDCLGGGGDDFINGYERKMGRSIIKAGYGLRPLIRHTRDFMVTRDNVFDCMPCESEVFPNMTKDEMSVLSPTCRERQYYRDIWIGSRYDDTIYMSINNRARASRDNIIFIVNRNLCNCSLLTPPPPPSPSSPGLLKRLKSLYDGKIPSLEDVVFFKTSRYLSDDMAKRINFTGEIDWNWN
jgi:hypothetical protein